MYHRVGSVYFFSVDTRLRDKPKEQRLIGLAIEFVPFLLSHGGKVRETLSIRQPKTPIVHICRSFRRPSAGAVRTPLVKPLFRFCG